MRQTREMSNSSMSWQPTAEMLALFPEIRELYLKLGEQQVEAGKIHIEMFKLALSREKERKE